MRSLRAAALTAFDRGDLTEAEQLFQASIDNARVTGRSPADMDILRFDLALTVERSGDRARADTMYETLIKSATDRGDTDMLGRVHSQLASSLNQTGDLDRASEHALLAFNLGEAAHSPMAQANAARNLGSIARLRGNLDETVRRYVQAQGLFASAGQVDYVAETLGGLAALEMQRDRLGIAQGYVDDGLRLPASQQARLALLLAAANVADRRNDLANAEHRYAELADLPALRAVTNGRATALSNLCGVRARLRSTTAEQSCRDALHETEAGNAPELTARAAYHLASVRYNAGDFEEALTLVRRSLLLLEANGSGATAFAVTARSQIERIVERKAADFPPLDPRRSRISDLNAQGVATYARGDYVQAQLLLAEALADAHRLADEDGEAMVLGNLGYLKMAQRRFGEARAYAEQSLAISERIGADHRTYAQLLLLGNLQAMSGERREATRTLTRGLAMVRGVSSRHEGEYLTVLATIQEHEKRWAEAGRLHLEVADIQRRLGDQRSLGLALMRAARSDVELGRLLDAETRLREALAAARVVGDLQGEHAIWFVQSGIDERRRQYGDARHHLTAALQLALQARAPGETRTTYDRLIALAERQRDAQGVAAWRKERDDVLGGRVMSRLQAARLAAALADIALQIGNREEGRLYLRRAVLLYRAMDQSASEEGRKAEKRLADLG
ncbi:MAG: hypothetical protein B7Y88_07195 [Sphingomonadales bacterium 32-64-17]|nr:MAG: hypothetical protein B7Y88_07195 [Sphingomonadales bacterium 32-64-17]